MYGEEFARDLNPAQWRALRYLNSANRFSKTVSGFARFYGTTLGTASQTVKSLVAKRYLRRRQDPNDGRRWSLELTAKARRVLRQDPLVVIDSVAADLRDSQRAALDSGLREMLSKLHEHEVMPCFGVCTDCRYLSALGHGRFGKRLHCDSANEDLAEEELHLSCINFEAAK